MHVGNSPKILISRLSHIGDCVLTLPMLCALRKAYPEAFIVWAVEKPTDQLLSPHPDIDDLLIIPKDWLKKPRVAWRIRQQLKKYKFDIAIDPQGFCKSSVLSWLSGAKVRIGLDGEMGREFSRWFNRDLVTTKSSHVVDRSLELLTPMGIEEPEVDFRMAIKNSALAFVDKFIANSDLQGKYTVINPGASWPSKMWEMDRFGKVAEYIHRQYGYRSVIPWAGDREKENGQEIVKHSDGAAILAPATDLQQLAALMYRGELFVGCDTGPMHIAAAVGTPCVGLYGPTRPQDSGAYGPIHAAVQAWYQSGNSRQRRQADNDAMRDISIDMVCRACSETLLQRPPRRNLAA